MVVEEEMGGKKICNWVVILCEVMVLFFFSRGGGGFLFNCCAYMIPNNDEACRQAGTFSTCSVFCFLFFVACYLLFPRRMDGW